MVLDIMQFRVTIYIGGNVTGLCERDDVPSNHKTSFKWQLIEFFVSTGMKTGYDYLISKDFDPFEVRITRMFYSCSVELTTNVPKLIF